jgi:hypothetical protein
MVQLSDEVRNALSGAEVEVYAWNRGKLELTVLVENQRRGLSGTLTFSEVHHFCLPTTIQVDRFAVCLAGELAESFWESSSVSHEQFDAAQSFFMFFDPAGGRFFVVADSVEYHKGA